LVDKATYPDKREVIAGGSEDKYGQTHEESARICQLAWQYDVGLVLLAGYLRKVQGPLLEEYGALPDHKNGYEARMLNTHPGPLPETKGLYGRGVHEHMAGLQKGGEVIWSAQTLHVVSADYDQGGVVAKNEFPIYPGDPVDKIEETAQTVEKAHIATDVDRFLRHQAKWKKMQNTEFPFTD
jgi:phosphoribosylglycinamide formyltransferase-1